MKKQSFLVVALVLISTGAMADTFHCELTTSKTLVRRGEDPTRLCGELTIASPDSPVNSGCHLGMSIQPTPSETWLTLDTLHNDGTIDREATLVYAAGEAPKNFSIKVATDYGMATAKCVLQQ